MTDRKLVAQVNQAVGFVQQHWQRLRVAAGNAFTAYGRGVFLFDLTTYQQAFEVTPAEIDYFAIASAGTASEGLARVLRSDDLAAYDPRRQIAFVFWHPDLEEAFIRVLTETPDGKPRLGPDRRWNNAPRTCPECSTEFVEPGAWGERPSEN